MEGINDREWIHRYADLIDESDVKEVKMVLQQYAARALTACTTNWNWSTKRTWTLSRTG